MEYRAFAELCPQRKPPNEKPPEYGRDAGEVRLKAGRDHDVPVGVLVTDMVGKLFIELPVITV